MFKKILNHYAYTAIFGIEDSLVSTVGLLSGIAIAGIERKTIILTGVILIFVEAISMSAGSFLSEVSAEEIKNNKYNAVKHSAKHGILMFFSYFVAGFIPLFPYVIKQISNPLIISIFLSLFTLFILGAIAAKISNLGILKRGLRMFIVGGIAIGIGVLIGIFFNF
ncbi:VIT1/CCC1 transporter family protein [Candidatus Wolfebacteria bacterium]|nr:VIT1/CCC1 transporter family protein [Candidatus Wolfebacteria bacterium]